MLGLEKIMKNFKFTILGIQVSLFIILIIFLSVEHTHLKTLFIVSTFFICILMLNLLFYYKITQNISSLFNKIFFQLDLMIQQDFSFSPEVEQDESLFSLFSTKLKKLYDILYSQKLQAIAEKSKIQELLSHISHQLNTPLSNCKIIVETLQSELLTQQDITSFTTLLCLQINKINFLIDNFIKTSKLENGMINLHPETNLFSEVIKHALSYILIDAEKKSIQIQVNCPSKLQGYFDFKWTGEAIFNLLDNAVKYSYNNSKITISVIEMNSHIRLQVIDTGKGIEEKYFSSIFQRFFRIPNTSSTEGVGLGLYLTRQILLLENATISVSSTPCKGTIFTIYFEKHT